MKNFVRLMILATAVIAGGALIAGCCCPIAFPGNYGKIQSDAQKLADEAAKRAEEANKIAAEAGIPRLEKLAAGETDLISNGDFSNGLTGWTTRTQPGSKIVGTNSVDLKGSGAKYLEFKRTDGSTDGGGAFASQNVNASVAGKTSLIVKLGAYVISEDGGNIANHNPIWFPEGACQVRVFYTAADGTAQEWYHGFYAKDVPGADTDHFTEVTAANWTSYASTNLMGSVPAPATINKIEVYGFGWNFDGYMTAIQLIEK